MDPLGGRCAAWHVCRCPLSTCCVLHMDRLPVGALGSLSNQGRSPECVDSLLCTDSVDALRGWHGGLLERSDTLARDLQSGQACGERDAVQGELRALRRQVEELGATRDVLVAANERLVARLEAVSGVSHGVQRLSDAPTRVRPARCGHALNCPCT